MADDAGALLVRSGLVSASALDDARARVASQGGTLGEQLVIAEVLTDDQLTDFYCTRLLVPQVNPNALARLTPKIVSTIPGDMAVELRAVPVSFDADSNLTVAMSDPSDRHAVDEISFFTGVYVVRAVATQMQIAWCLAHYYGHVTPLGQRLVRSSDRESPMKAAIVAAAQRIPRTKGLTGKVNAARHRAVAPVTGPVDVVRPNSGELDLRPLANAASSAPSPKPAAPVAPNRPALARSSPASTPTPPAVLATAPSPSAPAPPTAIPAATPPSTPTIPGAPGASAATAAPSSSAGTGLATTTLPGVGGISFVPGSAALLPDRPEPALPRSLVGADALASAALVGSGSLAGSTSLGGAIGAVPRAAPDAPTLPPINAAPASAAPAADRRANTAADADVARDGTPDKLRTRSISGEIRVPIRRAPSIRPPFPEPDEDDEPLITVEKGANDDATGPRKLPPMRRRIVKSDPPELRARAGEVDLKESVDRAIDADEPRIVIDEDALSPPTAPIDTRAARETPPPLSTIDVVDDAEQGALIHDRIDRGPAREPGNERESQPILLDRPRATPDHLESTRATSPDMPAVTDDDDDEDTGEIIVMLDATNQKHRPERRTQVGVP
ncbi:MAG TPA: hypothetical protein VLM79_17700, partial [Kofleriaceae bacterium]|nr:hypothetical protein [Kofleriaceae bacterium]